MSEPIYQTRDIRRIEQAAGETTPPLMDRAGAAAAELAARLIDESRKDVLILAGPGNNGGDARIVAALLQERFFRVTVASDPGELVDKPWGLLVDGLFGIGLSRNIEGGQGKLVEYANRQRCPVLALDIASGIHSDTGRVMGCAVRATHTVTFIAYKPGLLTLDGPDYCGSVSVATLGLGPESLVAPGAWLADPHLFSGAMKPRPRNFHKGMAGSVAILGGASGMTGAAILAGRASLHLGAGLVYLGLLDSHAPGLDGAAPELMLRHADDALGQDLDAIVIGPGLGDSERAETLVAAVLASDIPCVLDADALNLLSQNADLAAACVRRRAVTLLTPHPGEAARLLDASTAVVQSDRVQAARAISEKFHADVVLKGNGSVLAAADGHWFINTSGNSGMATAGMGDVLSGILGALLVQRYTGESALVLGVHLHGAAADELVSCGVGPVGLTASEVIRSARSVWNRWLAESG